MRKTIRKAFILTATLSLLASCVSQSPGIRKDSYFGDTENAKKKSKEKKLHLTFGYSKQFNVLSVGQNYNVGLGDTYTIGFAMLPKVKRSGVGFRLTIFSTEGNVTANGRRTTSRVTANPLLFLASWKIHYTLNIGYIKRRGPVFINFGAIFAPTSVVNTVKTNVNSTGVSYSYTGLGGGATASVEFFLAYPNVSIFFDNTFLYTYLMPGTLLQKIKGESISHNPNQGLYEMISIGVRVYVR